jgi:hypothetical protein
MRPWGLQKFKTPRYPDNRHTKVARLWSRTHRPPLPPRKYSWYSFFKRLSRPQGHSAVGGIKSTKNSNDTIGNLTRHLPSAVAQPNEQRRVPVYNLVLQNCIRYNYQYQNPDQALRFFKERLPKTIGWTHDYDVNLNNLCLRSRGIL